MPGTTIGINMNYGYPGQASRHGDEVSRTRAVAADSADIKFGAPVAMGDDGTVHAWTATDKAEAFAGIAMRKVKSAVIWPYQDWGVYRASEPCDMLQRGGVSALCAWGTPKVNGTVYVRTKVVSGTSPEGAAIGDLGADNEAGNCIELTGVKWSSDADARNVAELTILTRQGV